MVITPSFPMSLCLPSLIHSLFDLFLKQALPSASSEPGPGQVWRHSSRPALITWAPPEGRNHIHFILGHLPGPYPLCPAQGLAQSLCSSVFSGLKKTEGRNVLGLEGEFPRISSPTEVSCLWVGASGPCGRVVRLSICLSE